MCIVAPIGSMISRISFGTPMRCAALKLVGRVAIELCVAIDVIDGSIIFLKKDLTASMQPA
ncbi:hypothetical protein SDC9_182640 [bioreactor metagenome]|uniref:Uncharacterized protein n=1 Tax=bioreactor metagenome TaxID=1076179 RepID=A0A645H835_9ZZZZ